eukprot:SAG22_NODE_38_length_26325_cov_107.302067_3_plen_118_part_00
MTLRSILSSFLSLRAALPAVLSSQLAEELSRQAIEDFLDDEDISRLLIYYDAKGVLTAGHYPPTTYKKNAKSMYFLTPQRAGKVEPATIDDTVIYGDYNEKPLQLLDSVAKVRSASV